MRKTRRKTGRSSLRRSIRKNAEKDWKEHPEPQHAENMEWIQKDKTQGGATAGTAGAAATPRTEPNPRRADAKPRGGVETTRTERSQDNTGRQSGGRRRIGAELEEDWKGPKGTKEDAGESHGKLSKAQKRKKTGENREDYDQEIAQEKKIGNKARKTGQETTGVRKTTTPKEQEGNEKGRRIA